METLPYMQFIYEIDSSVPDHFGVATVDHYNYNLPYYSLILVDTKPVFLR